MGRTRETDGPSLAEAWTMLGARLGLQVESSGDDAVRAQGQVRGRPVVVQIERQAARSEGWRFLAGINTVSSRNRRDTWRTSLWVACANPSGLTGAIRSAVDLNDPAWTPGAYDPRAGRSVRSEPPWLAERVLDAGTHERLMSIMDDLTVHVTPTGVGIEEQGTSRPDSAGRYVAGSFLHHYQGPPPPWPERAIAGPPWWIDLLCDLADAVDRVGS
jgi:hypothetical protein